MKSIFRLIRAHIAIFRDNVKVCRGIISIQ